MSSTDPQICNDDMYMVDICERWISEFCSKVSKFDEYKSSYRLKHDVERHVGEYVTNESFIRAALNLGYGAKPYSETGPNAYFDMKVVLPGEEWKEVRPTGFSKWLFSQNKDDFTYGYLPCDAPHDKRWPRRSSDYFDFFSVENDENFKIWLDSAWKDYGNEVPPLNDVRDSVENQESWIYLGIDDDYPRATFGETYIYILLEKREICNEHYCYDYEILRYVGQSIDPANRLRNHIISPGSIEKTRWIGGVLNDDREIFMALIHKCIDKDATIIEHTANFVLAREHGWHMLNTHFFYEPCPDHEQWHLSRIGKW